MCSDVGLILQHTVNVASTALTECKRRLLRVQSNAFLNMYIDFFKSHPTFPKLIYSCAERCLAFRPSFKPPFSHSSSQFPQSVQFSLPPSSYSSFRFLLTCISTLLLSQSLAIVSILHANLPAADMPTLTRTFR